MVGGAAGSSLRKQFKTLIHLGVVGDLSDGPLLQRFITAQDNVAHMAFAVLVERHGPMVLSVCREVLRDPHDAQDAFQATFFILARKAGSVRKVDSLASWLHGVALRVSVRARADAARRRACERRDAAMKAAEHEREGNQRETWPELHEEVARLPAKYREPVVLCYLEGLTTEAAAARIGCPKGTVLSRLSRARERLRRRLIRRGLTLQSVSLGTEMFSSAMPRSLMESTVRVVTLMVAGRAAAGTVPAALLEGGVLRVMLVNNLKMIAAALSIIGVGVSGTAVLGFQQAGTHQEAPRSPDQENVPLTAKTEPPARAFDQVEFLKAQIETKRAELQRAEAQRNLALASVAVNERLNKRQAGLVSDEEKAKANAEVKISMADLLIKTSELRELELKLKWAMAQASMTAEAKSTANADTTEILRKLELRFSELENRLRKIEEKLDKNTKAIESRGPVLRP